MYAKLLNNLTDDSHDFERANSRIRQVIASDVPANEMSLFLSSFLQELDEASLDSFNDLHSLVASPVPSPFEMPQAPDVAENPDRGIEQDDFFLPGVFGRMSAFEDAEERLGQAQNQFELGNRERARQLLVEFLEHVQTQGWSVWNRPEENVVAAQRQLAGTSNDVSELVRAYKSLVLNESHEASWTLADSLIEQCDSLLSSNQSEQIFTTVVEHVRLMTGEHTYERNLYGSLG